MPRPKAILQSEFPYHVTARCINKEWFSLPLSDVWSVMSDQLFFVHQNYNALIHSFVLMNNHFHLLISTPSANLDTIMARFMKECSRNINDLSGRINQAYGARHYRTVIESDLYFHHVYKYVYFNPVKAGLVDRCENYKYSSLSFLLGQTKATFPVLEDYMLFSDVEKRLKWLNTSALNNDWNSVSRALRKANFKLSVRKHSLPNRLESQMF